MFTNNYIALRHNLFWGTYRASASSGGVFGKDFKSAGGASCYLWNSCSDLLYIDIGSYIGSVRIKSPSTTVATSSGTHAPGIYLGTGTTPAQATDYTMESPITSGLSVKFVEKGSIKEATGKYAAFSRVIIKNTSESDIDISEFGFFLNIPQTSSDWYLVMVEHTVLNKPITIKAGEEKIITYKLTFNQIFNAET